MIDDSSMNNRKRSVNGNRFQYAIAGVVKKPYVTFKFDKGLKMECAIKRAKQDGAVGKRKFTLPSINLGKGTTFEGKKIRVLKKRKMSRYNVVKNLIDRGTISKKYADRKAVSISKYVNRS